MSTLHSNSCFPSRLSAKGQIRLLKVRPEAEGSEEIECELETVNLKDNPSYVALSYTWGPPTTESADVAVAASIPARAIRCNGEVFQLSWNLYDFLSRARREPELNSQRLWIDAICINQQDLIERNGQVSFMASIYRSATMVVAWLGEEDAYTGDAFSLIITLESLCPSCRKQIMPKKRGSEAFESILGGLAEERAWKSLRQFWRRTYFKRAWIIQEVALARKVIAKCGSHTVDWGHIVQASRFSTVTPWTRFLNSEAHDPKDPKYSNHALPWYFRTNSNLEQTAGRYALLYALIWARRFECSDPRDKVYALLGLGAVDTERKPRLRPIYGDRSVVDTYISTAIQVLEDTTDLLLLAHSEGQDFHQIEGLPSWVPDWSCARALGLGIVGYKRFAAAGNLPRSLNVDESNMSLALHGLRLDRVVQVGESKQEALIHRKPEYFPDWISILFALPLVYHNGQSRSEVFWRTLITDTAARDPDPARHPAAEEYRLAFCDWIARIVQRWTDEPPTMKKTRFLEGLDCLVASDVVGVLPSNAEGLDMDLATNSLSHSTNMAIDSNDPPDAGNYDAILHPSSQTRLLRTSANYLGLATTSVREGDAVWIVAGSRVPLILREADSPNEYRLVGGAYIHGFMHGEALTSDAVLAEIKLV